MDHVTVPAVLRTPSGTDAVMVEVGVEDGWVTIAAAESGGPSLVVDECTMGRIVAAWAQLAAPAA